VIIIAELIETETTATNRTLAHHQQTQP